MNGCRQNKSPNSWLKHHINLQVIHMPPVHQLTSSEAKKMHISSFTYIEHIPNIIYPQNRSKRVNLFFYRSLCWSASGLLAAGRRTASSACGPSTGPVTQSLPRSACYLVCSPSRPLYTTRSSTISSARPSNKKSISWAASVGDPTSAVPLMPKTARRIPSTWCAMKTSQKLEQRNNQ